MTTITKQGNHKIITTDDSAEALRRSREQFRDEREKAGQFSVRKRATA